jgi:NTP pyrophosphatase (non-canonical NTP hydrolase)
MIDYQERIKEFMLPTANCPEYLVSGFVAEAGEVAGKWAKLIRDEGSTADFVRDMEKELGDVLWFVASLCNYYGLRMEDVMAKNYIKLLDRKQRNVIRGSGDTR